MTLTVSVVEEKEVYSVSTWQVNLIFDARPLFPKDTATSKKSSLLFGCLVADDSVKSAAFVADCFLCDCPVGSLLGCMWC